MVLYNHDYGPLLCFTKFLKYQMVVSSWSFIIVLIMVLYNGPSFIIVLYYGPSFIIVLYYGSSFIIVLYYGPLLWFVLYYGPLLWSILYYCPLLLLLFFIIPQDMIVYTRGYFILRSWGGGRGTRNTNVGWWVCEKINMAGTVPEKIYRWTRPSDILSSLDFVQITDRMNIMYIRPLCMHADGLNEISSQTNQVITASCQPMFTWMT